MARLKPTGSRLFPAKPLGVLRLAAAIPIPAALICIAEEPQGGSKRQHSEGASGAR